MQQKWDKSYKKEVQVFKCSHCKEWVYINEFMGTKNRNHCPFCLWSKHVDSEKSGDRKSICQALMRPIGLTFKKEGFDKYGKLRQGELMIVHECTNEDKISINRIAADDNPESILELFQNSKTMDQKTSQKLSESGIDLLVEKDEAEIKKQLYGKN